MNLHPLVESSGTAVLEVVRLLMKMRCPAPQQRSRTCSEHLLWLFRDPDGIRACAQGLSDIFTGRPMEQHHNKGKGLHAKFDDGA